MALGVFAADFTLRALLPSGDVELEGKLNAFSHTDSIAGQRGIGKRLDLG